MTIENYLSPLSLFIERIINNKNITLILKNK